MQCRSLAPISRKKLHLNLSAACLAAATDTRRPCSAHGTAGALGRTGWWILWCRVAAATRESLLHAAGSCLLLSGRRILVAADDNHLRRFFIWRDDNDRFGDDCWPGRRWQRLTWQRLPSSRPDSVSSWQGASKPHSGFTAVVGARLRHGHLSLQHSPSAVLQVMALSALNARTLHKSYTPGNARPNFDCLSQFSDEIDATMWRRVESLILRIRCCLPIVSDSQTFTTGLRAIVARPGFI